MLITSCSKRQTVFSSFDDYPTSNDNLWLAYTKEATTFKIWSPRATAVKLNFYNTGNDSEPITLFKLILMRNGMLKLLEFMQKLLV